MIVEQSNWRQCTQANPCLCGHTHWCAYSTDGAFVCMRPDEANVPAGYRKVSTRDDGGVIFAPDDGRTRNGHHRGNGQASSSTTKGKPYPTREAAIEAARRSVAKSSGVLIDAVSVGGEWTYNTADGGDAFGVVRFNFPGDKECRPFHESADGWVMTYPAGPRVLYRLPDLIGADPVEIVYVVEGEKAADALAACGVVVTTSPGGCKSAAKADWTSLRGRRVVVLPDHDDPGNTYAADVARLLRGSA